MQTFADLSHIGQIGAVRRALEPVLVRHGLEKHPIRLALHAYNTTFRMSLDGTDVAIRVYVNSSRTIEEVRGEVAWTQALAEQGSVTAPQPIPLFDGFPITTLRLEGIGRDLAVAAFRWLPGRHVGKNRPPRSAFLLGELMTNLHSMTRTWNLPRGTSRPVLKTVLDGLPWRLADGGPFREVCDRADAILERLRPAGQLVHFDLHFGNVKVWRGGMSVFDFDDCVITAPVVDAAQAMYYLRRRGVDDPLETAFWQGAGTTVEELGLSRADFEMLIGGRSVLLATDVAGSMSAALAEMAPRFVRMTERRLEHLLKTGVFDQSVAKMSDPQ